MRLLSGMERTRLTTNSAWSRISLSIRFRASISYRRAKSRIYRRRLFSASSNANENGNQPMLILSRDDMRRALDAAALFEAMTEGFQMLAEGQWKGPLRTA